FFSFVDPDSTLRLPLSLHDALPISMAVVDPHERSAAGGVTAVARSAGSSLAPLFAGRLLNLSMLNAPFFLAGGLKIVYDVLLYRDRKSPRLNSSHGSISYAVFCLKK